VLPYIAHCCLLCVWNQALIFLSARKQQSWPGVGHLWFPPPVLKCQTLDLKILRIFPKEPSSKCLRFWHSLCVIVVTHSLLLYQNLPFETTYHVHVWPVHWLANFLKADTLITHLPIQPPPQSLSDRMQKTMKCCRNWIPKEMWHEIVWIPL
jgi:hypothetical protein